MKKIFGLLLVFSAFISACDNKDEEDLLCMTPPSPFYFEVVDKTSGENLFEKGTFKFSMVDIINSETNERVSRRKYHLADNNLLLFTAPGWNTEKVNFSFKVGDKKIFDLYVDSSVLNENGCTFTRYNEVKITNANYKKVSEGWDHHKILID
ncbi:hypothetical protein FUAX_04600 [Fulvitalea axinellae]|uniref:Lipoprotein n=1 Tax=Fulvitalea axinellae TaxID=1182444 RepID=A0AAU9CJ70_9BACT|nr:hypothetical protein FUAX_04600 [Fulvitalea axinellae]